MDSPRIQNMLRVDNLLKTYMVISLITIGVLAFLNREHIDAFAIGCELASIGVMYLIVTKLLRNNEFVSKSLLCLLIVGKLVWTGKEVANKLNRKKKVKKLTK